MNELGFYNNLKIFILNSSSKELIKLDLLKEIDTRLKQLQHKEQVTKWNELCLLIESATRTYEREHNNYVNVTVNYDDNVITITNHI